MPISYMRYLNVSTKKRSQLFQGKKFVKKINICLGEGGIGVIFLLGSVWFLRIFH